jgi:LuxR family maltose regulon positive regulatory protein
MSGGRLSTSGTSALPRNSLLATKLFIPASRSNLVPRPRLLARLDQGLTAHLTLVSAPAGFGKTTLLSEWLSEHQYRAAWLTLDTGDNDLTRFLAYLIAALQMIHTDVGQAARSLLQSPQPPPMESVLTMLINEIATAWGDASLLPGTRYPLVLDDYHLISARPVHDAVCFSLTTCRRRCTW